jgi:AraC family transcriptional regulator
MGALLADGQYIGRVLRRRELAGLILTETGYAPRQALPRHAHANAYVCLVYRGRYTEEYGRRRRDCGPQTLAFHPPGEVHCEHTADAGEVRSFNIELPPAFLARAQLALPVLERSPDFQGGPAAELADRLYHEFRNPDAASALAVEGLALELLAAAWREAERRDPIRQPPPWLRRARERLDDQFADPPSLPELAAGVGVHPVYLAGQFRRHFRCSPGEYLRRRRVEEARRLLADSGRPLAEVALAAGFADQSHFTRTFKRHLGVTPARYRRDRH